MHIIELKIHAFLEEVKKGNYKVPNELLSKFSLETAAALKRQFESKVKKEFRLSLSGIGRPLCQLQMEKLHGSENSNKIRNLLGDIVEDITLFLLHASGINIVSELENVKLNIAGKILTGTLDVVIDLGDGPKVYDIKSASEYMFNNKFLSGGFLKIVEEDTFGYFCQLFGYATAKGIPAGGWIVTNKSSGELIVVEAPREQQALKN